MNIPVAEEYFLKSAREAFAEANASGTPTASPWVAKARQMLAVGDKINAIKLVREATNLGLKEAYDLVDSGRYASYATGSQHTVATAEAYLYAGRACYLQQKLPQAIAHAGDAYRLAPEFVEAGFEQAKYLAANSQDDEAVAVLQTVIGKDRYFSIKTLLDADLASKTSVLKLLGDLHAEAMLRAKQEHDRCRAISSNDSGARNLLEEAERHLAKNSFLSGMKALDLLTADYQLHYNEYRRDSEKIRRQKVAPAQTLVEFIRKENQSGLRLEILRDEVKRTIVMTRTLGFGAGGAAIGFVVGFFNGCTTFTSPGGPNEDLGTWFGTFVICAVVGAVIGAFVGTMTEPAIRD